MIDAVIFDMDGLLVDSEPLWMIAMQDVFASVGAQITPELAAQTTGLRTAEVVNYWYNYFKWEGKTEDEVSKEIIDSVWNQVATKGTMMEGVNEVLQFFQSKGLKLGLASSSPLQFILQILDHFNLRHYFSAISSAEHQSYGKPHPAVYLDCAAQLGVSPLRCLAFEDSINGTIAARAARMKVVAVPEAHNRNNPKYVIADMVLHSLVEFTEDKWVIVNRQS